MPVQLLIPGSRIDLSSARGGVRDGSAAAPAAADSVLLACVETVAAFQVAQIARAAEAKVESLEINDDDIVELEFENGFTLYTSAAKYQEDMQRYSPQSISPEGVAWRPVPRQASAERGLRDFGEKVLRILRLKPDAFVENSLDPSKWPAPVKEIAGKYAVKAGAWLTVRALTWRLENQLQPGAGLYRWPVEGGNPTLDFKNLKPIENLAATDKPLLVCIHGTASSTVGSFSRLFVRRETEGRCEPQREWLRIQRLFGENIFAFEHRSLSESPIENALRLAKALPKGAKVRLLSHSRGGLVGDLLCLPKITAQMRQAFRRDSSDVVDPRDKFDQDQLQELSDELERKQFDVTHFARVACPARGTLLASENIESFLSGLTSLIGLIPGVGTSVIHQVIKRVTLEVAKNRTNARWIPGIEAMVPDSPLVRMLNTIDGDTAETSLRAKGKLGVVAGDSEGGGLGHLIVTKVADWFIYSGCDNDWVVNTDSMYEGAPRSSGESHYVLDQGGDVSHFQYFANDRTRETVVDWLTYESDQPPRLFAPLAKEQPKRVLPRVARSAVGPRPIVFVLPGVMGSGLSCKGRAIWCDYGKLAKGGLNDLRDVLSADVQATELLSDYYGDLCEFLGQSHEVVPFPYDWRQPIVAAAKNLADQVTKRLEQAEQRPLRFIAHSTGGLVVRAMIQNDPALWDKLCDQRDSRLVMLGTPNHGSHAVIETLTGFDRLVRQLALLDSSQSIPSILDIVGGFPGVLELLPKEDALFLPRTWMAYRAANRQLGSLPTAERLTAAKSAVHDRKLEIPHPRRVAYVAGSAPRTVSGARVDNNRLVLDTTEQGDGRVTHESGRLPNVDMWYVDAQHGSLPSHVDAFEGYAELLHAGQTQRLSRRPIANRGGVAETITDPPLVLFPTRGDLVDSLLGRRPATTPKVNTRPLQIEVAHGDLCFASYPVMAGHFEGDTITGPEAVLDEKLDGLLSQRHRFGVYPGPVGTVYTALPTPNALDKYLTHQRGAVIIGLGGLGDLSPGILANSIREGVLDYVLEHAAKLGLASNGDAARHGVGLSVLLIGSATASLMSVEDSVGALLRGLAAASRDVERSQCPVVVDKVEIVELFADAAIDAARAVDRLATVIGREFEVRIEPSNRVKELKGRRQRLWSRGGNSAWRRWEITLIRSTPAVQAVGELPPILRERLRTCISQFDSLDKELFAAVLDMAFPRVTTTNRESLGLKFVVLSDRSRAERITQEFQAELIDDMVRDSVQDSRYRREQARSLGTLLVPNDLKDNMLHNSRLVLVVDEDTANYPWELMILSEKPLAVQIPLVRQLQLSRYRRQIRSSVGRSAYVVGEPKTSPGVPSLPAAKAEAKQVAEMLQAKGYQVDARYESPSANEVLEGLFARPYRIVHLAGHGYFEASAASSTKARCGMLLENGKYLTAVEISKMSQTPHLVFLNCCHLGKTGSQTPSPFIPFNKLAASMSQELIAMGVNAVVAAGWAVRDDAAELFASIFYGALLEGRTFSEALEGARQSVYAKFPDCNTWGAYQAYGDPDYRLSANLGDDPADIRQPHRKYFLVEEIVEDLRSLGADAREMQRSKSSQQGETPVRQALARIEEDCPQEWRMRPDVLAAFGRVYAELAEFQRAATYYSQALDRDAPDDGYDVEGTVRLKLVEQLANCEARWGETDKDPERVRGAIRRLKALLSIAESGERWALLGSAYKRLALASKADTDSPSSRQGIQEELKLAAEAYLRAWNRKSDNPYNSLNYIAVQCVRGEESLTIKAPRADGDKYETMKTVDYLAEVADRLRKQEAQSGNYWTAVAVPETKVLALLHEFPTDKHRVRETLHEIVELYDQAEKKYGVTPRERDSAMSQLKFLAECLPEGLEGAQAIRDIFQRLAAANSPQTIEAESGQADVPAAPPNRKKKSPAKSGEAKRRGSKQKSTKTGRNRKKSDD